ncbi:pleiotropic regulatory protein RsmS [Ferrimonas aestuarii]|uniref:DUF2496 domain-containing protein n=1 Tax=Ferrimonas aestuarii TaxID=2569539 RepID=A0A4U1BQ02_9GAMM|nr:pleiotropic regulatory protein RsmS [Ferrimonas aestuarii]TKB56703.1 DUF2496 domain-containing protein [Ferrimonas aestuarii]
MSLESAPDEIKLAVDLIYLLESNEIDPQTALKALAIVKQDLDAKVDSTPKMTVEASGS